MLIDPAEFAAAQRDGCAYPIDLAAPGIRGVIACGEPRRAGSAYCARHHQVCHLAPGSLAEARQLAEIEALAAAVGARLGRDLPAPPEALLRRLARLARDFSRPDRSRYVQKAGAADAAE